MTPAEWVYLIGGIASFIGGYLYIADWRRDRHSDDRRFSWKRWWTTQEGLAPTETLANGILLILTGILGAALLIWSLNQ